jgi:DNA primase
VYICYDGDEAGQKATLRALDILHSEGLKVKVISLPDNLDPDDFASQYGMAGINEQIESAMTRNDYKTDVIERDFDLESEEERKDFIIRVCSGVLSYIESPTELSMYVKRLSLKTGFDELVINQETQRAKRLHKSQDVRQADRERQSVRQSRSPELDLSGKRQNMRALVDAERLLFALALNHSDCADILLKNVKIDDFIEGIHREIAEIILGGIKKGETLTPAGVLGKLNDNAVSEAAHALGMPYDEQRRVDIARECLYKIHSHKKSLKISEINKRLKDPMLGREQRAGLMKELENLRN